MKKPVLIGVFLIVLIVAVYAVAQMNSEPKEVVTEEPAAEEPAAEVACPEVAPMVIVLTSVDTKTHIVLADGEEVGEIDMSAYPESEAHVYRQTDCSVWIAASGTGRGGYILYGGDDQLFRLNLATKRLTRVNFDGFLSDLSSDEKWIVSVSTVDGVAGSRPSIEVTNTETGAHEQYAVAEPYNDAGSAKFSPDNKLIAYAAVERVDGSGDPVTRSVWIIDLETGLQTLGPRADLEAGRAPYITGWTDNDTPIISDEM